MDLMPGIDRIVCGQTAENTTMQIEPCSPSLPDLILHAEDLLRNDPGQLPAVYSHHESSP